MHEQAEGNRQRQRHGRSPSESSRAQGCKQAAGRRRLGWSLLCPWSTATVAPAPSGGCVLCSLHPSVRDTRGHPWFGDGQGECELSTGRVRVPPQGLCCRFPALPREMIIVSEHLAGLEPWTAGPSWQSKSAWLWGTAAPRANTAAASWWVQRGRLGSAPSPSSLLCAAFSAH